jgi:hypothetical protein
MALIPSKLFLISHGLVARQTLTLCVSIMSGRVGILPRIKICEKEGWFLSVSLPYHGRPK